MSTQPAGGERPVSEGQEKAVIRTPDRRLRVFISSALEELAEERRAVARAISALRLTPVMFEQGARPHPPPDLYWAYLAQSEVFIGLYWQHYGQAPTGADISGLEEEFDLSAMLPKLGHLVRDDLAALPSDRFATSVSTRASAGRPRGPRPLPVSMPTTIPYYLERPARVRIAAMLPGKSQPKPNTMTTLLPGPVPGRPPPRARIQKIEGQLMESHLDNRNIHRRIASGRAMNDTMTAQDPGKEPLDPLDEDVAAGR
jgi:hypothetical protein